MITDIITILDPYENRPLFNIGLWRGNTDYEEIIEYVSNLDGNDRCISRLPVMLCRFFEERGEYALFLNSSSELGDDGVITFYEANNILKVKTPKGLDDYDGPVDSFFSKREADDTTGLGQALKSMFSKGLS